MNLSRELENYRERGAFPASLSKRFIRALNAEERKQLTKKLYDQLNAALEDTATSENDLLIVCLRIVRVRKIRKEKGEL
jgi:hypothetical protein